MSTPSVLNISEAEAEEADMSAISCPKHSTPGAPVLPLYLLPHGILGALTCDGTTECIHVSELDLPDFSVYPVRGQDGRAYVVAEAKA